MLQIDDYYKSEKNILKRLIKKILRSRGIEVSSVYRTYADYRFMSYFEYFLFLYSFINGKKGDFVECGIGKGRTFLILSYLARKESRNLMGFDSFRGFPQPSDEDSSSRTPQKGEWSGISPHDIKILLLNNGIGKTFVEENIRFYEGYFQETLPSYDGEIAFLHLDVDLYDSYKICLESLYDRVVPGGVICFDEYSEVKERFPGAEKAIDEFFAKRPETRIEYYKPFNKFFAIKGK